MATSLNLSRNCFRLVKKRMHGTKRRWRIDVDLANGKRLTLTKLVGEKLSADSEAPWPSYESEATGIYKEALIPWGTAQWPLKSKPTLSCWGVTVGNGICHVHIVLWINETGVRRWFGCSGNLFNGVLIRSPSASLRSVFRRIHAFIDQLSAHIHRESVA